MKKEKPIRLPKGFFQREMPIIPLSEAIKDIEPMEWDEDILEGRAKVILEPLYEGEDNIDEDKFYFKAIKINNNDKNIE